MESVPTLLEPGRAFLSKVALFLPNLLAALLILLGGWVLARAPPTWWRPWRTGS